MLRKATTRPVTAVTLPQRFGQSAAGHQSQTVDHNVANPYWWVGKIILSPANIQQQRWQA